MSDPISHNKLIAKNTQMLYIRMLIIMSVSLYTSRIVLNTLGVVNFGIYNVVGGFITMFGFMSSSMASATQRFLSFEIGKKDHPQLAKVFSMSVNIHVIIALVIFILAETIGLWFLNIKLTIPLERLSAANWVYQFSIFAFLVNIISVPYNATIIAHEKMNVFAWISIVEVSLKLLIVFMLQWLVYDKLKLYAVLIFSVSLLIRIIYSVYCRRHFSETKFRFFWDKSLFKKLISFAGWNLWGNIAAVMYGQGINILLNIFFGPAINAARGIAYQVKAAVYNFVENFQMAINPQIIKSFASNDIKYMHQLIFQGAKFSFFLLFILSLPILMETEMILKIWLKIVPDYTVIFTQLIIINILIDSVSGSLKTSAQASGKIKLYQGVVGGLLLLILPISYLFLKLGFEPQTTLYVSISMSIIAFIVRLKIISKLINLSILGFLKDVIFRIILVATISTVLPILIKYYFNEGFYRLIVIGLISLLSVLLTTYLIGLNNKERIFIQGKAKQLVAKIKRK